MTIKYYFLSLILVLSSFSASGISFPLPSENFVPAKMPMALVYPRPNNETQSHSRHRWAHPDMPYEVPIGVQGGAWPFKYEIISGPAGAVIGQLYGDENYGVVSWLPTTSTGEESFTIKITDQELNSITATWSVTIDANQFIFIDDDSSGAKIGTIDQPLGSWADWYKGDASDNTYANKIIVFRGGNYSVVGDPAHNGNVEINTGVKSPSIIGYPGELAILDCSTAKIFTRGGTNVKDIFIADIKWANGRQDVANAHFFWATNDVSRSTWWRNQFHNLLPGQVGTDNTSTVFVSDTGTHKNYFLYKHNTLTEIHNLGYNGSYVEAYGLSYWLVEENTARNSDSNAGFFGKQTVSFATTRANEAFDNIDGEQMGFGYNTPTGMGAPHDHEICWNRVRLPQNNQGTVGMMWAHNTVYDGKHYNSYIYRNTFVNGSSWIRFKGAENYEVEGNVVVSNLLSRWNTSIMNTTIPNVTGKEGDGITDQKGLLTGQYRLDFLGIAGHEISDVYVTKPKSVDSLRVD
jgi:hypothetical protein